MKIAVTGPTSFLGASFVAAARAAGHEIVALTRRRTAVLDAQTQTVVQRDVREITAADFAGADVVIDAGVDSPWTSFEQSSYITDANELFDLALDTMGKLRRVPKLPWWQVLRAAGLDTIFLAAPTTPDELLALIAAVDETGAWPDEKELLPPWLRQKFDAALDFLMSARCFLHFRHGRDDNTLVWEAQDEAAGLRKRAEQVSPQVEADGTGVYFPSLSSRTIASEGEDLIS